MREETIKLLEDRIFRVVDRLRALAHERDRLVAELEESRRREREAVSRAAAAETTRDELAGTVRAAIDDLRGLAGAGSRPEEDR